MKRSTLRRLAYVLAAAVVVVLTAWQLDALSRIREWRTMSAIMGAWKRVEAPARLAITYPRDGTLFPPGLPSPTFLWKDDTGEADTWLVVVELPDGSSPLTDWAKAQTWKPGSELWDTIKRHSLDYVARVSVLGIKGGEPGTILSSATIHIRTSRDEVGAPIFYRDVPLPFIYAAVHPSDIRWRLGDITSDRTPPVVLQDLPVCGNCHSFTRDGRTLAMDADYGNDKGSYVITDVEKRTRITPDRIISWTDYRPEDEIPTFGLLPQISPDGRYAISTGKDRAVFTPKHSLAYSHLFFPAKGILVVYDRETKRFWSLPGANDPKFVQSNPVWSPDVTYLIFARAPAVQIPGTEKSKAILLKRELARDFIDGKRTFKYDLYRIPFNNGEGGTPEPIPGASNNGMSNYFPRFSPDGKWIVFTKASNFMLLQPDSELYIMPAEGGTPRRMTCNTSNMNSWHSWSPNGKWLVFASKERGPYTQLFLTHIDEDGNDTPAVLLEYVTLAGRAANIPEFVNIRPDEMEEITAEFLDDKHFYRQGALADNFDYDASVKYYKRALEVNPNNLKARLNLGVAYREMGEDDLAEREWLKVIEERLPGPMAHNNLAILYLNRRQFDKAREMCEGAIEAWPDSASAYLHLGMVNAVTGNLAEAEVRFREGIRLEPSNAKAHAILGNTLESHGRPQEALKHYRTALRYMPAEVDDGLDVVNLLAHRSELAESLAPIVPKLLKDHQRLDGRIHPKSAAAYILLGRLHLRHGKVDSAITAFETAHKMQPSSEWLKAKIDELKNRKKEGGAYGRVEGVPAMASSP